MKTSLSPIPHQAFAEIILRRIFRIPRTVKSLRFDGTFPLKPEEKGFWIL
jgi:hypothetical protein